MPIYDRPTKSLMGDWVNEKKLTPGQAKKSDAANWFAELSEDQAQDGRDAWTLLLGSGLREVAVSGKS